MSDLDTVVDANLDLDAAPPATTATQEIAATAPVLEVRPGTPDPIVDALYQDIARRVLQGHSRASIAAATGYSTRQITRVFHDARFLDAYKRVRGAIYGDVDTVIKDEKIHVSLRRVAMQARAMTTLAEVMEAVRDHMDMYERPGQARAGHLRAAVDAARLALTEGEAKEGGDGAAKMQVNVFNLPHEAAAVIREGAAEADVDISDLLGDLAGGGATPPHEEAKDADTPSNEGSEGDADDS